MQYYRSSVTLVKPTPRLLHSLLSAFGFRPWEEGVFSRRGAQPRYRCVESAASPGEVLSQRELRKDRTERRHALLVVGGLRLLCTLARPRTFPLAG